MEKGIYHHRFCQVGQVSTDQRRKFHGCTCAGLSCLWSHQRTSSACGWIYARGNRLINHAHMKESDHLVTLAQKILGHRSSFVCSWSFAARMVTCERTRRMFGGQNVGKQRFQSLCQRQRLDCLWQLKRQSRNSQIGETGRIWSGHLLVAATKRHIRPVATYWFLGRPVPSRQTVPRAEVWGAIQILSRVDEKSNIQIPIGAKYVTRGITGTCGQSCSS